MGYISDDGTHEGWAAAEFPDGRFSSGSSSEGAHVRDLGPGPGPLRFTGEDSPADGRTAIGWRGLCVCGWRGPLHRRVAVAADEDPAAHLVYWPDPDKWADAPAPVDDAIRREWSAHLPAETITAVAAAAGEMSAAEDRLARAVLAARADGRSWEAIGQAAGVSRQTAHARWGKLAPPGRFYADFIAAKTPAELRGTTGEELRREARDEWRRQAGEQP